MTAIAVDLLHAVADAGGSIQLEGARLRVSAPAPLSDDLRNQLRQHKVELMALPSAADPEPESGSPSTDDLAVLPNEIASGVQRLLSAEAPDGIPPQRWPEVLSARRHAGQLARTCGAEQALAAESNPWLHDSLSLRVFRSRRRIVASRL